MKMKDKLPVNLVHSESVSKKPWPSEYPETPSPPLGERILRMKPSRFEPMNHKTCEIFSLAPIGGEGWGEGAIQSASRFMVRDGVRRRRRQLRPQKILKRYNLQNKISRRVFAGILLGALLMLQVAAPFALLAEEAYLTPGHPDGIALLPPPPEVGSAEAAADLLEARAVCKGRTPEEEARAKKDASLSFSIFEPAIGPIFQQGKLPKTEALMKKVKAEIGETINIPKDHWKRMRPYQVDPELASGMTEKSYSYPSGHSTRGTVYALVLAEIFPDKKDAILETGRTIGWDRVLIGMHFPTDVFAGRVLGKAIVRELMANPAFQHDLEAAKAEAQAAKP
jgi:acid phosphatase (class A)